MQQITWRTQKMPRTVIIDGDVVVYKVAEAVADNFDVSTEEQDDYIYRNIGWASKAKAQEVLDTMINDICSDCKAQNVCICLSDMNSNFRKSLNPLYKSNRRAIKPILYEYLRKYMFEAGYKVYERPSLEADDVIGILATSTKIINGSKFVIINFKGAIKAPFFIFMNRLLFYANHILVHIQYISFSVHKTLKKDKA